MPLGGRQQTTVLQFPTPAHFPKYPCWRHTTAQDENDSTSTPSTLNQTPSAPRHRQLCPPSQACPPPPRTCAHTHKVVFPQLVVCSKADQVPGWSAALPSSSHQGLKLSSWGKGDLVTGRKWAPTGSQAATPAPPCFAVTKTRSTFLPPVSLSEVGGGLNLEVCSFSSCSAFLFLFLNYYMGFSIFLPVFLCCKGNVSPKPAKGRGDVRAGGEKPPSLGPGMKLPPSVLTGWAVALSTVPGVAEPWPTCSQGGCQTGCTPNWVGVQVWKVGRDRREMFSSGVASPALGWHESWNLLLPLA